jgi:ABC-2 type transport system permease protein
MESLLTTPVRPAEVVIGKLIPYLVIGAFDVVMTFMVGYFAFGIHMRGSFLELLLLSLLFLVGTSMLGIFISSATKVQVMSIQAAMVVTYLPSFILSGFIFPIKNMPLLIQGVTYLVPARYMVSSIKAIVLKGIPAALLEVQIILMVLFALAMMILGISKLGTTVTD